MIWQLLISLNQNGFYAERRLCKHLNIGIYGAIMKHFLTLLQVFQQMGVSAYDLSVDMLDVHAVSNPASLFHISTSFITTCVPSLENHAMSDALPKVLIYENLLQ